MNIRLIPTLLLKDKGLYKTVKFKNENYIGDPINTVRIFNEKEVDELVFLDIEASAKKKEPDFSILEDIAGEAFMPMAYGGGISNINHVKEIFNLGFEKVILNSIAYKNMSLIEEASSIYGSQSIIACIDVKKNLFGKYTLYSSNGRVKQNTNYKEHILRLIDFGAGELLINSIEKDGTMSGYDIELISSISKEVNTPIIACGGAGKLSDMSLAAKTTGVSAVAAGSVFVYMGPRKGVLINYPDRKTIDELFIPNKKIY